MFERGGWFRAVHLSRTLIAQTDFKLKFMCVFINNDGPHFIALANEIAYEQIQLNDAIIWNE